MSKRPRRVDAGLVDRFGGIDTPAAVCSENTFFSFVSFFDSSMNGEIGIRGGASSRHCERRACGGIFVSLNQEANYANLPH